MIKNATTFLMSRKQEAITVGHYANKKAMTSQSDKADPESYDRQGGPPAQHFPTVSSGSSLAPEQNAPAQAPSFCRYVSPNQKRFGLTEGGSRGEEDNSQIVNDINAKPDNYDSGTEALAAAKQKALLMLDQIGWALRRTRSTTPATIISELRDASVNVDDARQLITSMIDDIREVNAIAGHKVDNIDLNDQMMSYVAVEMDRWNSDVSLPVPELTPRCVVADKNLAEADEKKKLQELELYNALGMLVNELMKKEEIANLHAKAAVRLTTRKHALKLEEDEMAKLREEVKAVTEKQNLTIRKAAEAERLLAHLQQVFKDKEAGKNASSSQVNTTLPSNGRRDTEVGSTKNDPVGSDKDTKLVKESMESEELVDSEHVAQLDRLRGLVRLREHQAENWYRECVVATQHLQNLRDTKKNLERQLSLLNKKPESTRCPEVHEEGEMKSKESCDRNVPPGGPHKSTRKSKK